MDLEILLAYSSITFYTVCLISSRQPWEEVWQTLAVFVALRPYPVPFPVTASRAPCRRSLLLHVILKGLSPKAFCSPPPRMWPGRPNFLFQDFRHLRWQRKLGVGGVRNVLAIYLYSHSSYHPWSSKYSRLPEIWVSFFHIHNQMYFFLIDR